MAEVGQFIDMGDRKADGDVTLTAKAEGDLLSGPTTSDTTKPSRQHLHLQLAARDLQLQGFAANRAGRTLAQHFVGVDIGGEVDRDRTAGKSRR